MHPIMVPLPPGERAIAKLLQQPDGNVYGIVPAPDNQWRFFRINKPKAGGTEAGTVEMVKAVPDLVLPPKEILANHALPWQWDAARKQGYALTSKGHLLSYRADGTTTDLGQVAGTRPFEEKEEGYQLSRMLLVTPAGDVYTAGDKGALYKYTPGAATVSKLEAHLPAVVGREPWASLDAAVIGPDGLIYGGTFDGYLFTFNPQTGAVTNLGKPFRAQRIASLAFRRGVLHGIGGDDDAMPRVFSFDPATRGFTLGAIFTLGLPERVLNYYEPVGACAADAAGNIYVSTLGRMGNLYLWPSA
ncbi:MAG TPA: hypothetical protein VNA16_07305 [Abditibacteriaceae bacterium]|nr:hypothetical protein [Abditibacteriaceae bacterium]